MSLQEQLEKVQNDLQKIEERRKELQQKEKELLTKMELEEARAAAKKNEEIRKIVEENYGEVDGSNLEIFRRVMQETSAVRNFEVAAQAAKMQEEFKINPPVSILFVSRRIAKDDE